MTSSLFSSLRFGPYELSQRVECYAQRATKVGLTPYNRSTFYGGEETGYTDYPTLDEAAA